MHTSFLLHILMRSIKHVVKMTSYDNKSIINTFRACCSKVGLQSKKKEICNTRSAVSEPPTYTQCLTLNTLLMGCGCSLVTKLHSMLVLMLTLKLKLSAKQTPAMRTLQKNKIHRGVTLRRIVH